MEIGFLRLPKSPREKHDEYAANRHLDYCTVGMTGTGAGSL